MPSYFSSHRTVKLTFLFSLLISFCLFLPSVSAETRLYPAQPSVLASKALLLDIQPLNQGLIAVGEQGVIIYKTTPQQAWQQAQVPVNTLLTSIKFVSANQGFAVGHQGTILATKNAGKSWQLVQHNPELPPLLSLGFVNKHLGFAVGAYGLAFKTQDGGNNWQEITDDLPNEDGWHLNSLLIDNQQNLYIAGEEGSLFVSSDLGASWQFYDLSSQFNSIFSLSLGSQGEIFLTGLRGSFGVSYNQGQTWQPLVSEPANLSFSLVLANNQLLLVGENGSYYLGEPNNLTRYQLASRSSLVAAAELDNKVYAVGKGGVHLLTLGGSHE